MKNIFSWLKKPIIVDQDVDSEDVVTKFKYLMNRSATGTTFMVRPESAETPENTAFTTHFPLLSGGTLNVVGNGIIDHNGDIAFVGPEKDYLDRQLHGFLTDLVRETYGLPVG